MSEKKEKFMEKIRNQLSGLQKFLLGLLIGCLIGSFFVYFHMKPKVMVEGVVDGTENADVVLEEHLLTHTTAEFQEAVLGFAKTHSELIIMEQPITITTTITKAGLGNLAIFSKVKNVTFKGEGIYTVDLSRFNAANVVVNQEKKNVVITVPSAQLQYVSFLVEETEYEDTERGLLAFGDIKLTTEELNELEVKVKETMSEHLEEARCLEDANKIAQLKMYQFFQEVVSAIEATYTVTIILK